MLRSLFLGLTSFLSLLALSPSAAAQQPAGLPGIRIVELDGRPVRVRTEGLENRKPGTPVVVLEAGATSSLDAWSSVIADAGQRAPVVAYDRAGLGKSEWDGVRPTPRHVTARLRRLLSAIGAGPPYVLVGHSWGGMLAYYFAGYYPKDVAGLVFVDPAPVLTQGRSGSLAPFAAIGAGKAGYDAYWNSFSSLVSNARPAVRAEFEVLRALQESELSARDLRPLPDVPLVVLVAGKYLHLPFFKDYPFDPRAYFEADLRHRLRLLEEWALASRSGLLLVSRTTAHSIPREEPQLVSWAIGRVLERTRK